MGTTQADEVYIKKVTIYRERNEVQRWLFHKELAELEAPVVYLNECGENGFLSTSKNVSGDGITEATTSLAYSSNLAG